MFYMAAGFRPQLNQALNLRNLVPPKCVMLNKIIEKRQPPKYPTWSYLRFQKEKEKEKEKTLAIAVEMNKLVLDLDNVCVFVVWEW